MSQPVVLFEADEAIFNDNSITPINTSTTANTPTPTTTTHNSRNPVPHRLRLKFPACYRNESKRLVIVQHDKDALTKYMEQDLSVVRLNSIHKHLWLAGLPLNTRPLHAQIMIGRHITITERTDLHLLWRQKELYLKPLPEYLLAHSTWTQILIPNPTLYASAAGLLYSYITLIMSQSDLQIAQTNSLLSPSITWDQWTTLSSAVLTSLATSRPKHKPHLTPTVINHRYIHGELRLARVNLIYRLLRPGHLFTGYHAPYTDYASFFAGNFAWVVTVVVYVTVVLTAMQVGLATHELGDSVGFNRASFGFTVFAIVGPLAVVAVVLGFGLVLVLWNLRYALRRRVDARVSSASVSNAATAATGVSSGVNAGVVNSAAIAGGGNIGGQAGSHMAAGAASIPLVPMKAGQNGSVV